MNSNYFLDTENGYGFFKGILKSNNIGLLIQAYDELKSFINTNQSTNINLIDIDYNDDYIGKTFH